jgi:myo-inositol-1(or 4)-monophosphatase
MAGVNQPDSVDLDRVTAVMGPLLRQAGHNALRWFRTPMAVTDKGGSAGYDPVTEADRSTEAILRAGLAQAFPDHQIEGEEGGVTGPDGAGTRWVIDPIDGTRAFVSGVPAWGLLVGLVVGDRAVAGWMRQPFTDETFEAVGGQGWYERGGSRTRLATRSTTALDAARLYTTHPDMFATDDDQERYGRLSAAVQLQRFGGDCYSYCLLALGFIDLVVEAGLHSYDIAALIPIVEAAGGVVTDLDGASPLSGGFVVAAATPELHAAALQVLRG